MILTQIRKLFDYNQWAWKRVFPSLAQLNDADYKQDRAVFWGSLHGVMVHCVAAEWIWLERVLGNSPTALLDPDEFVDFAGIQSRWHTESARWQTYLLGLDENQLGQIITSYATSGEARSFRLADILQHVMNHSTEHRAQMTPYLANLGVPTPPLDYIYYCVEMGVK